MSERTATEVADIKSAAVRRRLEAIPNRAFRGAFLKGRRARREGLTDEENPYRGESRFPSTHRGSGWQAIFARYWLEGWQTGGAP